MYRFHIECYNLEVLGLRNLFIPTNLAGQGHPRRAIVSAPTGSVVLTPKLPFGGGRHRHATQTHVPKVPFDNVVCQKWRHLIHYGLI
jgi:hypothetical protein